MIVENRLTPEQIERQRELESKARDIAKALDRAINPFDGIKEHGFALLLFAFGDQPQPATWISNGNRGDMIRVVEEWLERAKSRT